jgi:hypothetical protein
MHAALEGRDHIPSVVLVFGANDDSLDLLEEGVRAVEEPHAVLFRGLGATACVFVRYADEIRGVEIP